MWWRSCYQTTELNAALVGPRSDTLPTFRGASISWYTGKNRTVRAPMAVERCRPATAIQTGCFAAVIRKIVRDEVDTPPGEISPIQDPTSDYEDGRRQCEGVGSRRRGLPSYAARPQGGRENHWPRRRIEDVVESLQFCPS